jgi:hypothetical protein
MQLSKILGDFALKLNTFRTEAKFLRGFCLHWAAGTRAGSAVKMQF